MTIYNDDDEHGNTVTTKLVVMSRVIYALITSCIIDMCSYVMEKLSIRNG